MAGRTKHGNVSQITSHGERIVETMRDLHGITLSEGAVCSIIERAGKKAQPVAETIKE